MKDFLSFVELSTKLKQIQRKGWVIRNVKNAESVADHTFGVSLMAFMLSKYRPENLDHEKCMSMALVHDLAESIVGDITPHDDISVDEKQQREHEAMQEITQLIDDDELLALWQEYEMAETPEARFVKSLDKLEMLIQAFEYEQQQSGINLDEFWVSAQEHLDNRFSNWMPDFMIQSLLKDLITQRIKKKTDS